MELIQGSETSANYNLTPGKYPEENIHYSNHGESLKSRDSLKVTARLYSRKTGAELVAAAFTDHLAVVLRLAIDAPLPV